MGAHKATFEEDTGIQRTTPKGEAQDREGQMGSFPPRLDSPVLGVLTTWQREWDLLRGEWSLSSPFSFSVFSSSPPFSLTQKYTNPEPYFSDPFLFFLVYTYSHSVSVSLSLWAPHLPPSPHLSALGHNFWTEDIGHAPCASPPPPEGFITSYAAHLKPIELLGGQVSDSDIYLGGSFCYFRELLTGLWG